MTQITTKIASVFTLLIATALTSQANADAYSRIDRQAVKIQKKALLLVKETEHYRHTKYYHRLLSRTTELCDFATHIHEVTHYEGNLVQLRSDLRQLDAAFRDVERLFDRVEYKASLGHGHVKGNTAHVKRLLNTIDDCIDRIRHEVDSLLYDNHVVVAPKPVYKTPVRYVAPKPVYKKPVHYVAPKPYKHRAPYGGYSPNYYGKKYNHGRNYGKGVGITIGGGSSKIRIRF